MTVLIRSRSLMRGILHAQDDKTKTANANTTCVNITHSPSLATLTDWDSEEDNSQHSTADINTTAAPDTPDSNSTEESKERDPPIVDCCTEVDYSRRVEIAKSAGFIYDEVAGVESILQSLTPHERKFLADR